MAEQAGAKVEGLKPLQKALKNLGDGAEKQLRPIMLQGAQTGLAIARPLTPFKDGDLVGSLRAKATMTTGYLTAGSKKVPYAPAIHWGWPAHNIAGDQFLTEAAGKAEPTVVADANASMAHLIRKEGLK
jgi:hypothetical protein